MKRKKKQRIEYATIRLTQLDDDSPSAAVWFISALANASAGDPDMTVAEFLALAVRNMPKAAAAYLDLAQNNVAPALAGGSEE